MAVVLKDYIVKNKLYATIKDKNYVMVEGWQFAGALVGTRAMLDEPIDLSNDKEIKYKCKAEILDANDKVIGRGYAICSNREDKKKTFDEYAIMSMAQTRAIGKAYRSLVGWIMKLAGYETTPQEEITAKYVETQFKIDFEKTKAMIENCQNPDTLQKYEEQIENSKLTDEQKEELINTIMLQYEQLHS